jgi:ABC-2 type transport system ATP-binding protein|uniref:ABC transporter ATP-binding protein n=1 Tax=Desulfobacca acetoxidans TaxID=60893 RepID=A0A7C3V7V5_9BACT
MIHLQGLVKAYKGIQALRGIDLWVRPGELFAYLGPNGAGKTTTIRILAGLTRATAGRAWLNGHDIATEPLAAKKQFGLVPQHLNLDSELTVTENLLIHGMLHRLPYRTVRTRMEHLLEYVELTDKRRAFVKHLSGGMKRRLMIARALLHEPQILFLDEPSVGLDANIRRRIWALIKKIQQEGVTIFLTTHYIEEAEFLAERVAFLDQGRIVALDTPAKLMANLGQWAVDQFTHDNLKTHYFRSREEAQQFAASTTASFTLRRVNLEDAFLALTGRKVS